MSHRFDSSFCSVLYRGVFVIVHIGTSIVPLHLMLTMLLDTFVESWLYPWSYCCSWYDIIRSHGRSHTCGRPSHYLTFRVCPQLFLRDYLGIHPPPMGQLLRFRSPLMSDTLHSMLTWSGGDREALHAVHCQEWKRMWDPIIFLDPSFSSRTYA